MVNINLQNLERGSWCGTVEWLGGLGGLAQVPF